MRTQSIVLLVIALVILPGCARKRETAPPETKTLTILCGASFRPPMEKLVAEFKKTAGVQVELSFGQSEDLLPQVKIGKEGDLFVSHDPFQDDTEKAGALLDKVSVGSLAPALVVRKGNPAGVKSLEDLAKPGVKVALPNLEYSTCGKMLAKLLEKKAIKDAVFGNAEGAVFRGHSEIGNALKLGTRDAGVMWNGVAYTFRDAVDVVPTPYEYDETVNVWIMGLSYSKNIDLVKQFLEFSKTTGPGVFAENGYVK